VWGVSPVHADEHLPDISDVRIFVRTIEATGPITGDASKEAGAAILRIDQALKDLRPKLGQLPFSSFKLLASKEENLSLRKKEIVHLPNGQSLALRPMYMDHKRVGVWLNWKDTGGADILNTRIHFDADDSVLTGTDCAQDTGLILAIKAVPVAH
jgi:hypothetical protein